MLQVATLTLIGCTTSKINLYVPRQNSFLNRIILTLLERKIVFVSLFVVKCNAALRKNPIDDDDEVVARIPKASLQLMELGWIFSKVPKLNKVFSSAELI